MVGQGKMLGAISRRCSRQPSQLHVLTACWIVLIRPAASLPRTIPIGIVADSEHGSVGGARALQAALERFNARKDGGFFVNASIAYVSTQKPSALEYQTATCRLLRGGVAMVITVGSSSIMKTAASVYESLHMPHVWYHAQDFAEPPSTFRIQLAPPLARTLSDLIQLYRWKTVTYVYDDDAGLERLQALTAALSQSRRQVEVDPHLVSLSASRSVHAELRQLDETFDAMRLRASADKPGKDVTTRIRHITRVIVIDMSTSANMAALLDQLVDLGMIRDNYHLVLASLWADSLDMNKLRYGGATVTGFRLPQSQQEPAIDGSGQVELALASDAVRVVTEGLTNVDKSNSGLFRGLFRSGRLYNGITKQTYGLSCAAYNETWLRGRPLADALKQVRFQGLSGQVAFDNDGRRRSFRLEVMQMSPTAGIPRLTSVGTWSDDKGFDINQVKDEEDEEEVLHGEFNRTIIITTTLTEPFIIDRKLPPDAPADEPPYEGYCVDLANELAKLIGFRYVFRPVRDGKHGVIGPNGTWNGMIRELIDKTADMALAALTITSDRERVVDFSTPFMSLGISIMIKKPEKEKSSVFSFMSPLSSGVWLCIAAALGSVSTVLFVVARLSPYEWDVKQAEDGLIEADNQFSILNSIWCISGAILQQGTEYNPRSASGRALSSAWWFFTLIVVSSYTANLAAFLTVENNSLPFKDVEELSRSTHIKYGAVGSGTTMEFFQNSSLPVYQRMFKNFVMVGSSNEGIEKVRKSAGKYAFFIESAANEYIRERKPCDTVKVGENLDSKSYGVATQYGSELSHKVTLAVLKLHESGVLNKLQQKWWIDKGECVDAENADSATTPLDLLNVAGVFYILIGGLAVALLASLVEFIYGSFRDSKKFKKNIFQTMRSKAQLSVSGISEESIFQHLPGLRLPTLTVDPPDDDVF